MSAFPTFEQLLAMTRLLGEPARDLVIIGEGNTSARCDDAHFWVKASGHSMTDIGPGGLVQVRFAPILAFLDGADHGAAALADAVSAAKVDADAPRPSIEVLFHAAVLSDTADDGVTTLAHTHPVALNSILCSTRAEQYAARRIFPDEVVLCGPCSAFVPYTDPGLPLALAIRAQVRAYRAAWGEAPKVVLLANHGLITLGRTPQEAVNITLMAVKAARIFIGACSVGEPTYMTDDDIGHIWRRPDEIYRRRLFVQG
jgi:rhamnose utilization protein RhaD (predicted bifunctional aldolase and dehydrogenase)